MDGKALFAKNCAACHQANGKGIPGAFPALAGNAFVQGAPADVATVLLKGRGGMPDFSGSLTTPTSPRCSAMCAAAGATRPRRCHRHEVAASARSLGVAPADTRTPQQQALIPFHHPERAP
jgi:cytochrome c6